MAKGIDILVVEPGEAPRPAKVEDTLETFQQIVGGPIEAGCYLPQRVMLVCNSEGKNMGLMPNRENPTDTWRAARKRGIANEHNAAEQSAPHAGAR